MDFILYLINMIKKNLLSLLFFTIQCFFAFAQPPCNHTPGPNCMWNSAKACYGLKQFNSICGVGKNYTNYPFYSSFADSANYFNKPDAFNCQPWRILMNESNCCDNKNFNANSNCVNDSLNSYPSWTINPRLQVVGGGRLGGQDKALKIYTYPGDHVSTSQDNCRSEMILSPAMNDGDERYYSWSFKFPNNWTDDNISSCPSYSYSHYFIMQSHPVHGPTALNCVDQVPEILLTYKYNPVNNKRKINVLYGNHCDGITPFVGTFDLSKGVWYDVIMRVRWTTNPDTTQNNFTMEIYKDMTLINTIQGYGANLNKDASDTTKIIYQQLHFGLYRGKNDCAIQNYYFDEYSQATTRNGLHSIHVSNPTNLDDPGTLYPANIQNLPVVKGIKIYFARQENNLHIEVDEEISSYPLELTLYDLLGKKIKSMTISGSTYYELSRDKLGNGIYLYSVNNLVENTLSKGKFILY